MLRDGSIDTDSETVFVEYVYDAPAIGTWSPWFTDVRGRLRLGHGKPAQEHDGTRTAQQLAEKRLREGRGIDSVQKAQRSVLPGGWRSAARGDGANRWSPQPSILTFTGGVLGGELHNRVDMQAYPTACAISENFARASRADDQAPADAPCRPVR